MFDQSAYEVKTPCAPAPLAWTAVVKLVLGLQLDVIGHTPLWHPFMVEMGDFLAEDEIFQQRGSPLTRTQTVLIGNRTANITGEVRVGIIDLILGQKVVSFRDIPANRRMAGWKVSGLVAHVWATPMDNADACREGGNQPNCDHLDVRGGEDGKTEEGMPRLLTSGGTAGYSMANTSSTRLQPHWVCNHVPPWNWSNHNSSFGQP